MPGEKNFGVSFRCLSAFTHASLACATAGRLQLRCRTHPCTWVRGLKPGSIDRYIKHVYIYIYIYIYI